MPGGDSSVMRTGFLIGAWLALLACAGALRGAEPARASEASERSFASLIRGDSLEGWRGDFHGKSVENGVLEWTDGGHLWTAKEYGDFVLRFEFMLSEGANNGLAIRWPGQGDPAYTGMCELQILDNEAPVYQAMDLDPRQYHGSAYGMAAAQRGFLKPTGEWNSQEVVVVGSRIQVTLNGTVILDVDLSEIDEYMDDKPHPGKDRTKGHLGFAGHGEHHLKFRKLLIREL